MVCSFVGVMYQNLESWKLKSLIWLTIYYLGFGYAFIEIIKCFNEKTYIDADKNLDLRLIPHHSDLKTFIWASSVMIGTSVVLLVLHIVFKADIKKYYARVMFKDDLRREISLKKVRSDYPLRFIQLSSSFFKRESDLTEEERKKELDMTKDVIEQEDIDGTKKECAKDHKKEDPKVQVADNVSSMSEGNTACIICYTNPPNTLVEPCGHGGVCEECIFQLIKKERICPFCRKEMDTIYLVTKTPGSNVIKLDKEIALSVDRY